MYGGVVPDSEDAPGAYPTDDQVDAEFFKDVNTLLKEYVDAMEYAKLRLGLQTVMAVSARGNLYLQSSGLNKALLEANPKRCAQVVSRAINLIYVLSALAHPFMPETSDSMLTQINAPARIVPTVLSNDILAGHQISKPEHLFKTIDPKMADVWKAKFGGNETAAEPNADAPGMSKRKAAAAKKAAEKAAAVAGSDGPKSAEVLAWEQKVAEQGQIVRELKSKPKTPEGDQEVAVAVEQLKKLKLELAEFQKAK